MLPVAEANAQPELEASAGFWALRFSIKMQIISQSRLDVREYIRW